MQASTISRAIVLLAVAGSAWAMAMPGAGGQAMDISVHEAAIRGYQEQISLMKWIGVPIVTALAGAVAFLARALLQEVKSGRDALHKQTMDTTEAINLLRGAIEDRWSSGPKS